MGDEVTNKTNNLFKNAQNTKPQKFYKDYLKLGSDPYWLLYLIFFHIFQGFLYAVLKVVQNIDKSSLKLCFSNQQWSLP